MFIAIQNHVILVLPLVAADNMEKHWVCAQPRSNAPLHSTGIRDRSTGWIFFIVLANATPSNLTAKNHV